MKNNSRLEPFLLLTGQNDYQYFSMDAFNVDGEHSKLKQLNCLEVLNVSSLHFYHFFYQYLMGQSHQIFSAFFWHGWIYLRQEKNRCCFFKFSEAPPILR